MVSNGFKKASPTDKGAASLSLRQMSACACLGRRAQLREADGRWEGQVMDCSGQAYKCSTTALPWKCPRGRSAPEGNPFPCSTTMSQRDVDASTDAARVLS